MLEGIVIPQLYQLLIIFFTNSINLSIIGVSRYNPVYTRSADRYYADKLFEANGGRLKQEAIHLIRQDKSRYR